MSKKDRPNTDLAVALHYDGDNAPRVTAKGHGALANEIVRIAQDNDVPLREDANLVKLVSQVEIGEQVPKELYVAVAEVIAFAYYVTGRVPGDGPRNK